LYTACHPFREYLSSIAAENYGLKNSDLQELKLEITRAFKGDEKPPLLGGKKNIWTIRRIPFEQLAIVLHGKG